MKLDARYAQRASAATRRVRRRHSGMTVGRQHTVLSLVREYRQFSETLLRLAVSGARPPAVID
jgi:hypothetical protein